MMEFEILGEIPSQKNILRFAGGRAFYVNDEVKRYKADFAKQIPVKHKATTIYAPVRVGLSFYLKDRRKDAHNLCSVIYDALEYAGVIKNDRQIVGGAWTVLIDKSNPRVMVGVWIGKKGGE
jgi:Holliday junction resolvase RusA-like endonuclease